MYKTFQALSLPTPVLGGLATLVVVGMLMAFHSVVQGAVQNGELRRQAIAVQAGAVQRCKSLPNLSARNDCLQQTKVVALAAL